MKKSISKFKSYTKGRSFEYLVKQKLEKMGYTVIRSARSLTLDLIAFNEERVLFVECKKQRLTPKMIKNLKERMKVFKIPPNCYFALAYLNEKNRIFIEIFT